MLKDNDNQTVLGYAVSRMEFETARFLNNKLGNTYPNLENAIKRHKAEQHLRIKQLVEEIKQISTKK